MKEWIIGSSILHSDRFFSEYKATHMYLIVNVCFIITLLHFLKNNSGMKEEWSRLTSCRYESLSVVAFGFSKWLKVENRS